MNMASFVSDNGRFLQHDTRGQLVLPQRLLCCFSHRCKEKRHTFITNSHRDTFTCSQHSGLFLGWHMEALSDSRFAEDGLYRDNLQRKTWPSTEATVRQRWTASVHSGRKPPPSVHELTDTTLNHSGGVMGAKCASDGKARKKVQSDEKALWPASRCAECYIKSPVRDVEETVQTCDGMEM